MAGSRTSTGRQANQRGRGSRESRETRWIYLGTAIVLGIVLLIVAVGLILTWYLPPRQEVATIGSESFTAGEVLERALYLTESGNDAVRADPAGEGIDSLAHQSVLLQAGTPLVGEITDEQIRDAIVERFKMAEATDEVFADTYADFLSRSVISQDAFEELIRAGIIEDRLREQFRDDAPNSGDQFDVRAIATTNLTEAETLVAAVREGAGFVEAAIEIGVIAGEDEILELGWTAPEVVNERLIEAVRDLQTGEISDPVDDADNIGYEVYFIQERKSGEYEEEVLEQLAGKALADFLEEQKTALGLEITMSSGSREWIQGEFTDELLEALRG